MDDLEFNEAVVLIDKIYNKLYESNEVLHKVKNKYDKFQNIKSYLAKLEKIQEMVKENPNYVQALKEFYYNKYVIKPENIPNIFNQVLPYRKKRKNNKDDKLIKTYQERIINDQKMSIDIWIDYFLSDESNHIPIWAKYWAFQGMIRLGTLNKITSEFNKREKNNTCVFAELNKEALNLSIEYLIKMLKDEKIEDKDLELLLKSGSFKKIYEIMLRRTKKDTSDIYDGIWIKYNKGSNPINMVSSIQGYNTEWCIAGIGTANQQLNKGDFYIYYTKDNKGQYIVPRLAIRMENDNIIREICGIADKQNIEENLEKIIKDKIKNFKDKDEFYLGIQQLEYLTYIHQKWLKNEILTKEELTFLYEINNDIVGVVPKKDPRINEILNIRNKREDLAHIFNCREDEIALEEYELYDNPDKIVCLYNNLTIDEEKINFPKLLFVKGNITGNYLKDVKGFKSLKRIGGNANFDSLIDVKGFKNLVSIGGSANFSSLKTSIGFESLISIGENAYFPELIDTLGFTNLKIIGLKSFYPNYIEAYFPNITDAKGLENLEIIRGSAIFYSLRHLDCLPKLYEIRDEAIFSLLESINGIDKINIQSCGGKLHLNAELQKEWDNYLQYKIHK